MKCLATDYDGSLRVSEYVSEADRNAVLRWKKAGHLFVIDTGRSMESILQETEKNQIPVDYFITNNGGMVYDHNRTCLHASYLDHLMGLDVMYIAKEIGGVVSYVVNDGFYRHRVIVNPELEDKRYPGLKPDLSEEEVMNDMNIAQIVISMETTEQAALLAKRINSHFPESVEAYANQYVTDIVPKGISKASGLSFLAKKCSLNEDDIYTFGDADNDIPLITYGRHGAAIQSASEEVKAHAGRVYSSISEMITDIL